MDDFRSETEPGSPRPTEPQSDPVADVPWHTATSASDQFADAWASEVSLSTEPQPPLSSTLPEQDEVSLSDAPWPSEHTMPTDAQPASSLTPLERDEPAASLAESEWMSDLPPHAETPSPAAPENPAQLPAPVAFTKTPPPAALGGRQVMMVVLAVLLGGTATFAMLMSSRGAAGDPSTASTARTPATRAKVSAAAGTPEPRWNNANRDWVGNQRHAVAFELRAMNKVQAWQHVAHPTLVVRCVSKRVEAFVFIESAAQLEARDENHSVRVQFDNGPQSAERWADSDEHDALFAPDGAAFTRRLMSARTLQFGYTPHNSPRATVEFHVAGLRQLVGPAAKACGMTP